MLAAAACSSGTSATPAGSMATTTTTAQASSAAIAGPARPGLTARASRIQAVNDATNGTANESDVYAGVAALAPGLQRVLQAMPTGGIDAATVSWTIESGKTPVRCALPQMFWDRAWELRRIGDLNPGGWLHPTALAARVASVRISSTWTAVLNRSMGDGVGRW